MTTSDEHPIGGPSPSPLKEAGRSRFHGLLKEIAELHDMKQADYGGEHDPFANVRASDEWGVLPWQGAMIRATDKLRRLQTFARTGRLRNEGVEDSFKDLAVYTLIALVLYQEGKGNQGQRGEITARLF